MSRRDLGVFIALTVLVAALATHAVVYVVFSVVVAGAVYLILFRRSKKTLLVLASLVISAVLFEVLGSWYVRSRHEQWYSADVDHRMMPNAERGINEDGIRSNDASHYGPDSFNIVFLGDSMTYGFKVPAETAFPTRVGDLLNEREKGASIKVANFAWVSSSPLLSYRQLQDIGSKYHPDLVILCVDMTDFHDDLRYRARLEANEKVSFSFTQYLLKRAKLWGYWERIRKGFRFYAPPPDPERGLPKARYFVTDRPLRDSKPYLHEIERNILSIEEFCRTQLKAGFVLVLLPRGYQYSDKESPLATYESSQYEALGPYVEEPVRWLEDFRERVSFPVFSILEDFKQCGVFPTCLEDDPHWNPEGHRVAAEAVVRHLYRLREAGEIRFP